MLSKIDKKINFLSQRFFSSGEQYSPDEFSNFCVESYNKRKTEYLSFLSSIKTKKDLKQISISNISYPISSIPCYRFSFTYPQVDSLDQLVFHLSFFLPLISVYLSTGEIYNDDDLNLDTKIVYPKTTFEIPDYFQKHVDLVLLELKKYFPTYTLLPSQMCISKLDNALTPSLKKGDVNLFNILFTDHML